MKKRLLVGLMSAAMTAVLLPGVVTAEDSFECSGTLGEAFTDTLVVPTFDICSIKLIGQETTGNMEVGDTASLYIDRAIVKGDITLGSRSRVYLDGYSTLYGDISCSEDTVYPSRVFLAPGTSWSPATVVVGDIDETCVIGYK